jgi:hypothetical protein
VIACSGWDSGTLIGVVVVEVIHGDDPYLLMTVQPVGILLVPYSSANAVGFVNVPEDVTLLTQFVVGSVTGVHDVKLTSIDESFVQLWNMK